MEKKKVKDSMIEMRELVLPNDTNLLGNLLGGRLLHWVDIAAAMVASRHASNIVATASIDSVDFKCPVKVGEMLTLKARLTWVGNSSMEVMVEVYSENYLTGEEKFTNKAYLTFVALDGNGKPTKVPKLDIEGECEKAEFAMAEKRRAERLARRQSNC